MSELAPLLRGQLLNAAFLHLRRAHPTWSDESTNYVFHDCDMLPSESVKSEYMRPLGSAPGVRVLQAGGRAWGFTQRGLVLFLGRSLFVIMLFKGGKSGFSSGGNLA